MHADEGHRNCVVLTTCPVLAAPLPATRTCGEAAGEWAWASCESGYEYLSRAAARCCGGGEVYCPAPQLCADPAAFDPAAQYAGPECVSYITATFNQSMCAAAGCMVYGGSGSGSGSGSGLGGGYFCDSQLIGACASENATSNGTSMGCWDAIYAHFSLGDAHVLLPHDACMHFGLFSPCGCTVLLFDCIAPAWGVCRWADGRGRDVMRRRRSRGGGRQLHHIGGMPASDRTALQWLFLWLWLWLWLDGVHRRVMCWRVHLR